MQAYIKVVYFIEFKFLFSIFTVEQMEAHWARSARRSCSDSKWPNVTIVITHIFIFRQWFEHWKNFQNYILPDSTTAEKKLSKSQLQETGTRRLHPMKIALLTRRSGYLCNIWGILIKMIPALIGIWLFFNNSQLRHVVELWKCQSDKKKKKKRIDTDL